MMLRPSILPVLLGLAFSAAVPAQQAPTLQQRMDANDFKASGLDQLSPAQLQHLQQWLAAHAAELVTAIPASQAASAAAAVGATPARKAPADDVVHSRIAGSFKGWGAHTTFVLQNGQAWRVVDHSDLTVTKTLESPEVTIKPGMMRTWVFKVAGYNTSARVEPAN